MGLSGLEPPTSRLSGVRSNQLSYKPSWFQWQSHLCHFKNQNPGGHLLSRTVSSAVPSADRVLTVVFGMGTGVSPDRIAARSFWLSAAPSPGSARLAARFRFASSRWSHSSYAALQPRFPVSFAPGQRFCSSAQILIGNHIDNQTVKHTSRPLLRLLFRKEVIQPHLPIRLPCYDFTPVIRPTLGSSLSFKLGH